VVDDRARFVKRVIMAIADDPSFVVDDDMVTAFPETRSPDAFARKSIGIGARRGLDHVFARSRIGGPHHQAPSRRCSNTRSLHRRRG